MSGIVSIGRYRKKKEKEEKALEALDRKLEACEQAAAEDDGTMESAIRMVAALGAMAGAMLNTQFGRQMEEEERKTEENFRRRYQDVFDKAPDMPVARVKYFCGLLLELWRSVEKGGLKSDSMEYDDFCRLYMEGVDRSVSDWCRRDQKTKEIDEEVRSEYPIYEMNITKENMGHLLSETLEEIIFARPERGAAAKKGFLWQLLRLFEIYRGILYVLSDETETAKETWA